MFPGESIWSVDSILATTPTHTHPGESQHVRLFVRPFPSIAWAYVDILAGKLSAKFWGFPFLDSIPTTQVRLWVKDKGSANCTSSACTHSADTSTRRQEPAANTLQDNHSSLRGPSLLTPLRTTPGSWMPRGFCQRTTSATKSIQVNQPRLRIGWSYSALCAQPSHFSRGCLSSFQKMWWR